MTTGQFLATIAAFIVAITPGALAWVRANSAHQRISAQQRITGQLQRASQDLQQPGFQPPVAEVLAQVGYRYLTELAAAEALPVPAPRSPVPPPVAGTPAGAL